LGRGCCLAVPLLGVPMLCSVVQTKRSKVNWGWWAEEYWIETHCGASLWLGAGKSYSDLCSLRYSSCHYHYFHNISLGVVLLFLWNFFPDLHVGQKALIPAQWFQYHHLQSHRPTLSPCEHPVEDSISLGSVPYLPYTLQLSLVIIKSCSFEALHNCFSSNLSPSTT